MQARNWVKHGNHFKGNGNFYLEIRNKNSTLKGTKINNKFKPKLRPLKIPCPYHFKIFHQINSIFSDFYSSRRPTHRFEKGKSIPLSFILFSCKQTSQKGQTLLLLFMERAEASGWKKS